MSGQGPWYNLMTRPVIQFDQRQDAEAKIITSDRFHETFGPKRPASGLFQNPVTRRDLTTPCEDDKTRPMRVNDAPEGLIITKSSSSPRELIPQSPSFNWQDVGVSVQPQTWRARSATRRFRVRSKAIGVPFPLSAPPCRSLLKACTVWGRRSGGSGWPYQLFLFVLIPRGVHPRRVYIQA